MAVNYTPGRKKATANYMKDKHTIRVVVKNEKFEEYMTIAQRKGLSLTQFIVNCVETCLRTSEAAVTTNDLTAKSGETTMCECEFLARVELKGIQKGIQEGSFRILAELVNDGTITIQKAAKKAGMDETAFKEKMNEQ